MWEVHGMSSATVIFVFVGLFITIVSAFFFALKLNGFL